MFSKTNSWSFDIQLSKTTIIVISWVEITKGVTLGVFLDVLWRSMGCQRRVSEAKKPFLFLFKR
jgi:hypothetical protein